MGQTNRDWSPLTPSGGSDPREHDVVTLTVDVPEDGLKSGDVGTIVSVYADGEAFAVEFIAFDGETIAIADVRADQARPASADDIKRASREPAAV